MPTSPQNFALVVHWFFHGHDVFHVHGLTIIDITCILCTLLSDLWPRDQRDKVQGKFS
jgi:hypothetical protein